MAKTNMPIYFSTLTYRVTQYVKKNKKLELSKPYTRSSREVHIGNTIEVLNDKKYNNRVLNMLIKENEKKHGCILSIVAIETIAQCGFTNQRFDEE